VDPDAVPLGDRMADRLPDRLQVGGAGRAVLAAELGRHGDPCLLAPLDRERGQAPGAHRPAPLDDRALEILGVVVPPPDDQEIVEATDHEQLAPVEEAEVARAQERAFAVVRGRPEALACGPRTPQVPGGHVRCPDPDLADPALGERRAGLGVDDAELPLDARRAAAHERARPGGAPGHRVPLERGGVDRYRARRRVRRASRHEERRLGEAVAGVRRLGAEPVRREGARERLDRRRSDALGRVERDRPRGEVEPLALLRGRARGAQLVREVRRAADPSPVRGDRAEPADRSHQECLGGHEDAVPAHVDRLEHLADEPHVVEERQPAHERGMVEPPAGRLHDGRVRDQVPVGDDHALRVGRRPGGVLDESAAAEIRRPCGSGRRCGVRDRVRGDPREVLSRRDVARGEVRRGEHRGGPRVPRDPAEARRGTPGMRGRGGHGDGPGEQATEERLHELEPRRIDEEHAPSREPSRCELVRDGPRARGERREAEGAVLALAVREEGERGRAGPLGGDAVEHVDEVSRPLAHRAPPRAPSRRARIG